MDSSLEVITRVEGSRPGAQPSSASAASISPRVMPRMNSTVSRYGWFSDASATSRSAGLALNATPSPAAASMSMSLAPSPTATVCSIGTPACCGKVPQRLGFSRPVDDGADHPAGQLAVDDLELVGRDEVHLQLVRERVDDLAEAAGHDAAVIAQAPQRAQRGACARRQLDLLADLVEHLGGQARQRRDPAVQRLGEVQLATHRGLGDLGDGRLRARAVGEHLDDLTLDQGGVDVKDDEPLGPSRQAVVLERDVDALVDRHPASAACSCS